MLGRLGGRVARDEVDGGLRLSAETFIFLCLGTLFQSPLVLSQIKCDCSFSGCHLTCTGPGWNVDL